MVCQFNKNIKFSTFIIIYFIDVIFDPEIVPYLVKTIDYLIRNKFSTTAYISSVIRNPDTYKLFLDKLRKFHLKTYS